MPASLWTPASTAMLDQASEHVRRRSQHEGIDLGTRDVEYALGLMLSWARRHEEPLNSNHLWVPELHWLGCVVSEAGRNPGATKVMRGMLEDWERAHPDRLA